MQTRKTSCQFFFSTCQTIFHNTKQGIVHYLHHAQVFELLTVTNEKDHQHCKGCPPHWSALRQALTHFSLEVVFHPSATAEETRTATTTTTSASEGEKEVINKKRKAEKSMQMFIEQMNNVSEMVDDQVMREEVVEGALAAEELHFVDV